jgi:hypothetical protein
MIHLPRTKAALLIRAQEEVLLDQELRAVMTSKALEAWDKANDASMDRVREAFYQDCVEFDIPNSREHCQIVTMRTLMEWTGLA